MYTARHTSPLLTAVPLLGLLVCRTNAFDPSDGDAYEMNIIAAETMAKKLSMDGAVKHFKELIGKKETLLTDKMR
jgi:hypothetical protein